VSQLHDLSGRLPALLQMLQGRLLRAGRLRLALGRRKPRAAPSAAGLPAEFERFVRIGERLERGLEELKDIQWQIRENEARYRDLLDNQADVILRRDAQGRLSFVNRAFCGVFGLEREDVLGRPFAHRVLAGDAVLPLTAGGALRQQRYVQEIDTAAGPRWFEWEEHAVPASETSVAEVQCLGRDITEERRAEAELKEARKQAVAANRAKSRFLAAMSHEIRTPMNGILGMTQLLCETELAPEQQTYARAIDQSARTLLILIDEILDFSKIEADKLQLNCAGVAIEDCVQGVVELLAPKAYEKGIDIAWAVDPKLPRHLLGDEVRLRQIITNLVGNAIKFTDAGGVLITVAPAAHSGKPSAGEVAVAITVEDTGIGIAAEALAALFGEFEQAEVAFERRQGGTGLGLAISRRLARAMAGDIQVTSRPGCGSTFVATVRLKPAEQPLAPRPARAGAASIPHVLLALDRPVERRALRLALEGAGVPLEEGSVFSAADLIEAAAGLGEPFTTLVVDGRCGVMTATSLLAAARQAAGQQAVHGIVVLNTAAKADFAEFRAAGFATYLVRPVRPRSLLTHLGAGSVQPSEPAGRTKATAEPSWLAGPPRILLVEDNDINALLARRMLEKVGCVASLCGNGREAVDAVRRVIAGSEQPYDLILMDVHMPVLDGLEATRSIKSLWGAVADGTATSPPIVALTANAFDDDRRRCLEAGMDDYLAKPFDREDLYRLLKRWCSSGRTRAA
jgi:PAS domain S-box-containing protein